MFRDDLSADISFAKTKKQFILGIDFDGCVVPDDFPNYPSGFIEGAKEGLIELHQMGHILVLYTLRDHGERFSKSLQDALKFLHENDLDFILLPNQIGGIFGCKLAASYYIDDRNIGGMLNWKDIVEFIRIKTMEPGPVRV